MRREIVIKNMKELLFDLKKGYHLPVKFRSIPLEDWEIERPNYIRYLERRLERFESADGKQDSKRV